jgi:SAM-dependent methyltransferase
MIEVGTWKGASAIRTAALMKEYKISDPQLLCIDTWLGSVENWLDPRYFPSLLLKWGRPELYNTFINNVIIKGHTDVIIPFPVDTSTAAKFLLRKKMFADAIYLDASHEYQDVVADLAAYWQVLRPGGVFIGDDYEPYWPGVVRAVNEFTARFRLPLNTSISPTTYLFEKPT